MNARGLQDYVATSHRLCWSKTCGTPPDDTWQHLMPARLEHRVGTDASSQSVLADVSKTAARHAASDAETSGSWQGEQWSKRQKHGHPAASSSKRLQLEPSASSVLSGSEPPVPLHGERPGRAPSAAPAPAVAAANPASPGPCTDGDQAVLPAGVTCHLHNPKMIMPAAGTRHLESASATASLCPALLIKWTQRAGTPSIHGKLHTCPLPMLTWQERLAQNEEQTDAVACLALLCTQSCCFQARLVHLCEIWGQPVAVAAQVTELELALSDGGWDQCRRSQKLTSQI